jgi:hypothetical protein
MLKSSQKVAAFAVSRRHVASCYGDGSTPIASTDAADFVASINANAAHPLPS